VRGGGGVGPRARGGGGGLAARPRALDQGGENRRRDWHRSSEPNAKAGCLAMPHGLSTEVFPDMLFFG
jgi:hypothetical protein